MKTRSGFVSNSSSSSFIISSKERPVYKIEIDLAKMAEYIIRNEEELTNYYVNWSGCDDLDEVLEDYSQEYNEALARIENGETIYVVDVANDSYDSESEYLYNHGISDKNTNFTLISGG